MHGCHYFFETLMKYKLFKDIHFNPSAGHAAAASQHNIWTSATWRLYHQSGACDEEHTAQWTGDFAGSQVSILLKRFISRTLCTVPWKKQESECHFKNVIQAASTGTTLCNLKDEKIFMQQWLTGEQIYTESKTFSLSQSALVALIFTLGVTLVPISFKKDPPARGEDNDKLPACWLSLFPWGTQSIADQTKVCPQSNTHLLSTA